MRFSVRATNIGYYFAMMADGYRDQNYSFPNDNNSSENSQMDIDFEKDSIAQGIQPANVIMIVIGVLAIVLNVFTVISIAVIRHGLSTNLKLILSLCLSDVLVSLCVLLGMIRMNPFNNNSETCGYIAWRGLKMASHIISLFNLLGLGLDHYFAIVKPLEYLTKTTACFPSCMIILFWITAGLAGFSDLYIPSDLYFYCKSFSNGHHGFTDTANVSDHVNVSYFTAVLEKTLQETATNSSSVPLSFCETVVCSTYKTEYVIFSLVAVLLVSLICLYTRVCLEIHHRLKYFCGRRHTLQRNKSGVVTTMIVVVVFILCWLPYCLFEVTIFLCMLTRPQESIKYFSLSAWLDPYLYNLLLLNSLCDPIIYALRMREVRLGHLYVFRLISGRWAGRDVHASVRLCNSNSPASSLSRGGRQPRQYRNHSKENGSRVSTFQGSNERPDREDCVPQQTYTHHTFTSV